MKIVMKPDATKAQVAEVSAQVEANGLTPHIMENEGHTVIGAVGDGHGVSLDLFNSMAGVESVASVSQPYELASRQYNPKGSTFALGDFTVGGEDVIIIAGPCSVESRSQLLETAQAVREAGANALRGGVYKPRTSPYAFQGLGEEGLEYMAEARELTGMPIVSEVMSQVQLEVMVKYVDVLQIGARNMQNFNLLRAVGETRSAVLLKRGLSATIEELLMSAEYILAGGNRRVMLCERGIRTFETATRNTTDINAVPVLKGLTHLPILLDPSHSTGEASYVSPVARAAIAAGADGIIVEVHPDPAHARSDGKQSLKPEAFANMVRQIKVIAEAIGRRVAPVKSHTFKSG
jgi:3-deoxy-7-phosphoheptulonate synthase